MDRQKKNALRKRLRQLWLYAGLPVMVVCIVILAVFGIRKLDKIWDAGTPALSTADKEIPEPSGNQTVADTEAEQEETQNVESEPEGIAENSEASESGLPQETEGTGEAQGEAESGETDAEPESSVPESTESTEPDVTPPVMTGVQNLTVEVGSNISYKRNVTVTDDSGDCELIITAAGVDLNTVGTYEAVYTAVDAAGNSTSQTIVVTVVSPSEVTEEEIYRMADEVIASCVTEEMTLYEKAEALWKWCHYQIKYSYSSGERGLLAGAYEGLHDRKGDCYAYYATYEVLLTRVGIENMCVTRIGGTSNHWWNLVNLGDGWYHCDTSPRKIGHKYKCFMQTDEQVAAYTEAYTALYPEHPNYFVFESSLYPERATEIIVESKIP